MGGEPTGRGATIQPRAVLIGVSTGGPEALSHVIPLLAGSLPVPVAVVQHMPPGFIASMAARLDAASALRVREAAGGEVMRAGEIWVAPGGAHMELRRQGARVVTRLGNGEPENSCRPAVDVLLRTACEAYDSGLLVVILTGMGKDGRQGAAIVRSQGGRVLAQDRATSVVWGMPGAVVEAGLADEVLPLDRIAARINELAVTGWPPR